MPTLTIEYQDENERLGLEMAIAYFTQLRQAAHTAPNGSVLAVCERVALESGRALLRSTLAAAVESRIAHDEQKGGPRGSAPKRTPDTPRANTREPS
jgi:hypothetical protein